MTSYNESDECTYCYIEISKYDFHRYCDKKGNLYCSVECYREHNNLVTGIDMIKDTDNETIARMVEEVNDFVIRNSNQDNLGLHNFRVED